MSSMMYSEAIAINRTTPGSRLVLRIFRITPNKLRIMYLPVLTLLLLLAPVAWLNNDAPVSLARRRIHHILVKLQLNFKPPNFAK